jgi:hypothetical protein
MTGSGVRNGERRRAMADLPAQPQIELGCSVSRADSTGTMRGSWQTQPGHQGERTSDDDDTHQGGADGCGGANSGMGVRASQGIWVKTSSTSAFLTFLRSSGAASRH